MSPKSRPLVLGGFATHAPRLSPPPSGGWGDERGAEGDEKGGAVTQQAGGEGGFRLQPAATPIGRHGTHAAVRASALRIIASVSASP